MSEWSKQATRPTQPRLSMQTAGERQVSVQHFDTPRTARVSPVRVNVTESRGAPYIGNLDEIVERERSRLLGTGSTKTLLGQQPGLNNAPKPGCGGGPL